jgi:hypothetical protein
MANRKAREKAGGAYASNKPWNERNREKYLAHKSVANAIKRGILKKKPCEVCGTAKFVHAHHDDYSKRLEVNWLCPKHHKERHAMLALREPMKEAA